MEIFTPQAERNVPLDHLLEDEEFPGMQRLAALARNSLSDVADAKGGKDNSDLPSLLSVATCFSLIQSKHFLSFKSLQ